MFPSFIAFRAHMNEQHDKPDSLNWYPDIGYEALITVSAPDLRVPTSPMLSTPSFSRPTRLTFAVSYLFVAIL